MSEPEDPTPWKRDAAGAPDGFAELARADAQSGPTNAQLTRVIERLALQVSAPELAQAFRSGPGAAQQAAVRSGAGARYGLFSKLIVAACAFGAVAFGVFKLEAMRRSRVPAVAEAPVSTHVQAPAAAARADDGAAARPSTPPAVVAASPVVPSAPAPASAHRSARPAPDAAGELRLLESAQQALRDDPARALAIAEQHRQRFAHGEFVQEREMLAIEALVALGQNARAATRARAFARHYPDSTYLPHLRDLVHMTP